LAGQLAHQRAFAHRWKADETTALVSLRIARASLATKATDTLATPVLATSNPTIQYR